MISPIWQICEQLLHVFNHIIDSLLIILKGIVHTETIHENKTYRLDITNISLK